MNREARRKLGRFVDDYDHGRVDPSVRIPDFVMAVVREQLDSIDETMPCSCHGCPNEATWEDGEFAYCDEHPDEPNAWQRRYVRLRSRVEGALQQTTQQELRAAVVDAIDADAIKD